MKLRDFQISELSPHPRNYRHHPDDQIAELRTSIREFGMVRNIVVSSNFRESHRPSESFLTRSLRTRVESGH